MFDLVQHALFSSCAAHAATATFMFLPSWKGMSTNAYMKIVDENQEQCTILGTIPKASVIYAQSQVWVGVPTELPPPQWDLNIIAVWNEEAKVQLF